MFGKWQYHKDSESTTVFIVVKEEGCLVIDTQRKIKIGSIYLKNSRFDFTPYGNKRSYPMTVRDNFFSYRDSENQLHEFQRVK